MRKRCYCDLQQDADTAATAAVTAAVAGAAESFNSK